VEQAARKISDWLEQNAEGVACVVGPTASGKTALSLAVADLRGDVEVVSCDSVQVYRYFDIGAGKPTEEERTRAPHHMLDVNDPLDPIEAATFQVEAARALKGIHARGKRALVVGGTFLWMKALVQGLAWAPPSNAAIRARHAELAEREGRAVLHACLQLVDPILYQKLHPNDLVRVSRALEVYQLTGVALSTWQAPHGFRVANFPHRMFGLAMTPNDLSTRIDARVQMFWRQGFVAEVEALIARGFRDARAMQSVGYAEVQAMLNGDLARTDLHAKVVQSTRILARRQRTWLRDADVEWL
jgi:tRNA dimethylallyltransferase